MDLQSEAVQPGSVGEGFSDLPLTRQALEFVRERHSGQRRDADEAPFVMHPLEVATLLRDCGCGDEVVAAGMLHEVLEDTDAEKGELEKRFGHEVAELVEALTDDPSIANPQERRAALRLQVAQAGRPTATIFAADKLSKTRELRFKAARGQVGDEERAKLEHYQESLDMLAEALPGHELVERLRFELEALRAL